MTSPAGKQTNKHMRAAHVSLIQLLFRMWNANEADAVRDLFLKLADRLLFAPF